MPLRNRLSPNLVAAGLGFLLALGLSEFLLRLTVSDRDLDLHAGLPAEFDDLPALEGIWDLVGPNVRGSFKGHLYRTNSAGFRGPEYRVVKDSDVFRIAMIGDSITMGSGVAEEEAYPALIEAALNSVSDDRRYEVLNLGLAGLNLAQSVSNRLKPIGLRYSPDLIIYGFTINDLESKSYWKMPRAYYPHEESRNSRWHLIRLLEERWRFIREVVHPPAHSYVYELDQNFFNNLWAWQGFSDALDELRRVTTENATCTQVVIHTHLYSLGFLHPFKRHYDAVASAARERGFHVVPTLPAFVGKRAPSLWVKRFDPHPNATGHRILAEATIEGLSTLPSSCWKGSLPSYFR